MDPSTAVRTDALPALATLMAPAVVASSGYAWMWVGGASPEVLEFLGDHEAIATIAVVLILVSVGFVIDSLGSYVEVYGIDHQRSDRAEVMEVWWKYLTIAWAREPIGQRYLRRLLVTFKFELNMAVAAVLALPSVPRLVHYGLLGSGRGLATAGVLIAVAVVFFFFARSTSQVLANVHGHLVAGIWEPERERPQSVDRKP